MGPEIRQQPGVFDLDRSCPGIFAGHAVYADARGDRAEFLKFRMVRLQRTHLLRSKAGPSQGVERQQYHLAAKVREREVLPMLVLQCETAYLFAGGSHNLTSFHA